MALAVAALLVVAGAIGLVVTRDRGSGTHATDTVATAPTVPASTAPDESTVPAVTEPEIRGSQDSIFDAALLGDEVAPPPIPAGWKVLDYMDFRFAVPTDWSVPTSSSCAQLHLSGAVVVTDFARCTPTPTLPDSVLTIRQASAPAGDQAVQLGTLTAHVVPSSTCGDCPTVYQFDDGYQVSATGPLADQVLSTFTDSGFRRVLQQGPLADTKAWQEVDYKGVGFRVPGGWLVQDLSGPGNGYADPDMCGAPMFGTDLPGVFLNHVNWAPSCALYFDYPLQPADGVWIRELKESDLPAFALPSTTGMTHDLSVTFGDTPLQRDVPSPVFDFTIRSGSHFYWVTVGVGTDASVARSILRSFHSLCRLDATGQVVCD